MQVLELQSTLHWRIGVASSLAAAFSFAVAALLVKLASSVASVLTILWARGLLQIGLLGAFFLWRRSSPWGPPELRWWLVLRGTLGVCTIIGYFIGIIILPVADAIPRYRGPGSWEVGPPAEAPLEEGGPACQKGAGK